MSCTDTFTIEADEVVSRLARCPNPQELSFEDEVQFATQTIEVGESHLQLEDRAEVGLVKTSQSHVLGPWIEARLIEIEHAISAARSKMPDVVPSTAGACPIASVSKNDREWGLLFDKLWRLSKYPDGWNGYAAPAPKITAVFAAWSFLRALHDLACVPTRVAASAVGGVCITKRIGLRKVSIEFFNDNGSSALFADDAEKTMETTTVGSSRSEFLSLITRIKDYLGV